MRPALTITLLATGLGVTMMTISAPGAASKPKMLSGTWGGDRMILTVDASGGRIQMDCASGTITGKIIPDAKGRFTARGTFDAGHGGPLRAEDVSPRPHPATFSGQMAGQDMKLSITSGHQSPAQNYALHKGQIPKLVRCL